MLEFRRASLDELEKMFEVYISAIAEMDRKGINQWDEIYPTREILAADTARNETTVGEIDGRIACVFAINQEADPEYETGAWQFPKETAYVIHRLCVAADFQNQGIARQALDEITRQIRALGGKSIRLDVFTENPYAQRLYKSFGFTKIGQIKLRKGYFDLMEKKL